MKKIAVLCAMIALLVLAGCTTIQPIATSGSVSGSKTGEATAMFLGPSAISGIPFGSADLSIEKAAENGGITSVASVSQKTVNYWFVCKVTTIVTGN